MSSPETQAPTMASTLLARAMLRRNPRGGKVNKRELRPAPALTCCSPLQADPTVADQVKHHKNHTIQCST